MCPTSIKSRAELTDRPRSTWYPSDDGLATIGYRVLAMQVPLLVEGAPGTGGKSALAKALAQTPDIELIRFPGYEGIDPSHAIYESDFNRHFLHLGAAETTGDSIAGQCEALGGTERSTYDERTLLTRPIMQALRQSWGVVVVLASHGWESDDPALLGERLGQSGIVAALLPIDPLPSADSLWRFEDMLEVLSDA